MDHNTGVSWAVPFPLCRKWLWEDTLYWVGLLVRWPWGGVCGEGRRGCKLVYLEGYGHVADTVLITSGWCTTQLRTVTPLGRTGSFTMQTTGWPCLFLWALLSSLCWASCFCYSILLRWGTVCLARTTLWTWGCSSGLLGICLIPGISISILRPIYRVLLRGSGLLMIMFNNFILGGKLTLYVLGDSVPECRVKGTCKVLHPFGVDSQEQHSTCWRWELF